MILGTISKILNCGPWSHNVGGVKCQPLLQHSNHKKRVLKMIFRGGGCFQFPGAAVISLQRKKAYALPKLVHYKFCFFIGVESDE